MDLSVFASQQFTQALTNIFLALFTLLLTAVVRVGLSYYNAKTTSAQRHTVSDIANIAVTTAEQLALANHIDVSAKKDYAEGIVVHELGLIGLRLTPTQIDTAIENAVYNAFNYDKQTTSTPVTTSAPAAPAA